MLSRRVGASAVSAASRANTKEASLGLLNVSAGMLQLALPVRRPGVACACAAGQVSGAPGSPIRPRTSSDRPRSSPASAVAAPSAPPAPPTDGDTDSSSTARSSHTAPRTAPEPASTSGRTAARRLHLHSAQHAPLHLHGHLHQQQRHQHQHHPTLRLIASRLRSGTQPGARRDGARLGLVVEGGGMRGCISGAMLMALHDLGVSHVFDVVYGASAGAINATYFLTGQRCGLRIYHEDLTQGTAFLDFRNLFSSSGAPVMNVDFLIDTVMNTSKPLDWDGVLASPAPLKVVASCLDSLQPVILSDFQDRAELAEALKATAAVPQIAGPPRQLRGRQLVDAAVFEPVPVPSAIRDGCTHVLVLCTRPAPTQRSHWAQRMRSTIEVLAKSTVLNAPYMREAWRTARSPAIVSRDQQLVAALHACPHEIQRSMGAYVLPLYPEHTAGCHPLCLDPQTLLAACNVGRQALLRLLGPVVAAHSGPEAVRAAAANGRMASAAAAMAVGGSGVEEYLAGLSDAMAADLDLVTAASAALGGGGGGSSTASSTNVGGNAGAVSDAGIMDGSSRSSGSNQRGVSNAFGDAELYSADMQLQYRP
ncbi:hypothetical protein HYH02_002456 [Chlamydomonas schloesseri]|uniref:Patatin n=1 Tax=Chlamydomonas schloesseri TaxID=2026947 RepID=A0A836BBR8_9CHLO|nr:hypothetical protein HYH02_002456 [Chlamydomonas schloesseri]|eukprot:KAG2453129.1 hypothetical protein HYH02_002456 [Chlamydomonas schloesseri]